MANDDGCDDGLDDMDDDPVPPPTGPRWSDLADPTTMPTEGLEIELVSHAAWEAVGLARMLDLLGEYDRRDGWAHWIGCLSLQQWLSWRCGLGVTAATERIRVARRLPSLPVTRRLLHEGALSWSKVRALTRVATPRDDAMWADLATMLTAEQLDRLVRTQRRITAADVQAQDDTKGLTDVLDADGAHVIQLRLPPDEAAPVLATINAAAGPPQRGVSPSRRRADAAVGLVLGRAEVRTEVEIHIEECPTCERRTASTAAGAPLHPDVADAVACDADLVTTHDHDHDHERSPADIDRAEVGEVDRRRGPNRQQRRWLARHHRTCQFPGCHHTGYLDAHHVIAHRAGGRTRVHNLVLLCRAHHRLVHLAGLVLALDERRHLTVTTPGGRPIDAPILRAALRLPPPDDPARISGLGERMDIDACLFAIHTAGRPTTPPTALPRVPLPDDQSPPAAA